MPNTLQSFLAAATPKASADLVAAFLRLPEDRRDWSPQDTARSAVDQVAECAILNGYTADLIQTRQWPIRDFNDMLREKAAAAATDWETLPRCCRRTRSAWSSRSVPSPTMPWTWKSLCPGGLRRWPRSSPIRIGT